ncbi:unnamed protein product [Adineta ricciae]|uniref:Nephrocystin-3 n=1 Tax=Adineta ricciae TaxID=249248 RepID=A0A815Q3D7_ADIRI|nr:unnamed protein product [Adineta ricciae]CAF1457702.1 unnamed protein product [Adineta ricciae]
MNNETKRDLNQLDSSFMYTKLLKEIILNMNFDDKAKRDFIQYLFNEYENNQSMLHLINEFNKNYKNHSSLWWYTKESFIYEILNKAFRTQNIDLLIKMAFFIQDLLEEIKHSHIDPFDEQCPRIVYRGQAISNEDFQQIRNNIGCLLSFNNFLSTSKDYDVAFLYAESIKQNSSVISVLFRIQIDFVESSTYFTSLNQITQHHDENEILFSMHSVFRIENVKKIDDQLWEIQLKLTSDDDEQLNRLTDYFRKEFGKTSGWKRLGLLMLKTGHFRQAEEIFNKLLLLAQPNNFKEIAHLYQLLAFVYVQQANFTAAFSSLVKALQIRLKYFPSDHLMIITEYNNIAETFRQIGDYSNALLLYQYILQTYQNENSWNSDALIGICNNMGLIYSLLNDHSKALSFYEITLTITKELLPLNHPATSIVHSNVSDIYTHIGDYSKALLHLQQCLHIRQKTLPNDHPSMAIVYDKISILYKLLGHYPNALHFSQKAMEIQIKSLPHDHPDLAVIYANIGEIYELSKNYTEALLFYQKSLHIDEKIIPRHIARLSGVYNRIGCLYNLNRDYLTALSFYNQALEMLQKSSCDGFASQIASTYYNIAQIYKSMNDYSTALSFCHKAIDTVEKATHINYQQLAIMYGCNGFLYQSAGDHSAAETCFQKALEICERFFSSHSILLGGIYYGFSLVYASMGSYTTALSYNQKGLEFFQQSLLDSPILPLMYNQNGELYGILGDESNALSSYKIALEIQQKSNPNDVETILMFYTNIVNVFAKLGDVSNTQLFYEKLERLRNENGSHQDKFLHENYISMGNLYFQQKNHDMALHCYEKALAFEKDGDFQCLYTIVGAYNGIGLTHLSMGNYETALIFFYKCLEIQGKDIDEGQLEHAFLYYNIGRAYEAIEDYENALKFFHKSLEIKQKCLPANHPSLLNTHLGLSEICAKLHQYRAAQEHLLQAVGIDNQVDESNTSAVDKNNDLIEKL